MAHGCVAPRQSDDPALPVGTVAILKIEVLDGKVYGWYGFYPIKAVERPRTDPGMVRITTGYVQEQFSYLVPATAYDEIHRAAVAQAQSCQPKEEAA